MRAIISLLLMAFFTGSTLSQVFTKISSGPETNDGGDSRAVNWIDYDNDGDLDLYVTNGPRAGQNNFFYINNGDGTFTKDTEIAIANDGKASDGSSWGDYDNDGDVDLFVANWWNHNNLLYVNNGDKSFTLLTETPVYTDRGYSETGSWGDYNNDGFLDLYVCNSYTGSFRNFLYKNNKDGSFTKITEGAMVNDQFVSRNVDWIDFDEDGDNDIFVTNEEGGHENIYLNNGDETFTKQTTGILFNSAGNSTSSAWEDFDNDGDFDVYIANYGNLNNNNFYFANNGDGTFEKITAGPMVSVRANSFGTAAGDVDNDGDVDLYVTNAFAGTSETNNQFFLNNGDGTFERNTDDASANDGGWSYGCALGDYDKDGYLDLFVGKCFNANENNSLFRNNGGTNNWLIMDLEGRISNRSAIGAVVRVKANINGSGVWQTRRVAGQNGYCGQNLQVHFGLGTAVMADSVEIKWPSGITEYLTDVEAKQFLKIIEDTTLTSVGVLNNYPDKHILFPNYPNPFNPSTVINYRIAENSHVLLKIYDTLGTEIATLVNEQQSPGTYEVEFHLDSHNSRLSSGVYFYRLITEGYAETKKMIVQK